jgi:hypothetical protein
MVAKFFIYRNLHLKDTFSIRFRGRVIDRLTDFIAHDAQFRVSQRGRSRVILQKQKNVHAFVVANAYQVMDTINLRELTRISYNPYMSTHFMLNDAPIHAASTVLFTNGQCYLVKE